jgi:uncharacterized protein (TIGR04255 family)
MSEQVFQIHSDVEFETLPHAPIVEAVVEMQCSGLGGLNIEATREHFSAKLNGYKFRDLQNEITVSVTSHPKPSSQLSEFMKGVRFQSDDGKYVASFGRHGFTFSRLEPYETWESFYTEAMKLWQLYLDLGPPASIDRLGLRFINRIPVDSSRHEIEYYLESHPRHPRGLDVPMVQFLHRDTLRVPGHPYMINLVRAMQSMDHDGQRDFIIIDIDVYAGGHMEPNSKRIPEMLTDMRKLKNRVFFGTITEEFYKRLQRE